MEKEEEEEEEDFIRGKSYQFLSPSLIWRGGGLFIAIHSNYEVASVRRIDKIIGLVCKRAL